MLGGAGLMQTEADGVTGEIIVRWKGFLDALKLNGYRVAVTHISAQRKVL